jgi:hypothetical protein
VLDFGTHYCRRPTGQKRRKSICRLPLGHPGRCASCPKQIFQGVPAAIEGKIRTGALHTRGNALPFFNRSFRWNRICLLPNEQLPPEFPHNGVIRQVDYVGQDPNQIKGVLGEDFFFWVGEDQEPQTHWEEGKHYLKVAHGDAKRNNRLAMGIPAMEFAPEDTCFQVLVHLVRLLFYMEDGPSRSKENWELLNYYIAKEGLLDEQNLKDFELPSKQRGLLDSDGKLICPLCRQRVYMKELEGAQGETPVDLFHIVPLRVGEINHRPDNTTWGHHRCNVSMRDHTLMETLQWMLDIVVANGLAVPQKFNGF